MVLQLDYPKYLANITIPCLGFPKDLIIDLAIKLEHLGTSTGLISTGIKRIPLEKITQGKITARWIDNSPSISRHIGRKREVTTLPTGSDVLCQEAAAQIV